MVNYKGGIALSRCGLDLSILDTDATNDPPRRFYDIVNSQLWEVDLAVVREVRLAAKIAHLTLGPFGDNLTEIFDVFVFVAGPPANGLGDGVMVKVVVQGLLEKVEVPGFETLDPCSHELGWWRVGHCGEATGG